MYKDHYTQAEHYLERAEKEGDSTVRSGFRQAAQAHAILALSDTVRDANRQFNDGLVELMGVLRSRGS